MGRVEGLSKEEKQELMGREKSVVISGRGGGVKDGNGGRMVMGGDLAWACEHTTPSADAVLWNCASETWLR